MFPNRPIPPEFANKSPKTLPTVSTKPKVAPVVSDLSSKEQRFLDTLATLHQQGMNEVGRDLAAPLSGQSHRSSAYTALVTELSKRGFLDYPTPGKLSLTLQGQAVAKPSAPPVSNAQLQEAWFAQLKSYEVKLARELLQAYPKALSRDELSVYSELSSTSSRFSEAVSRLRAYGLADYPAPGMVVAGPNFFLKSPVAF